MRKSWMRTMGLLGLGLFAFAGLGRAAGDNPGPIDGLQDLQDAGKMLFKLADENNDGQISQKEAVDAGNLMVGGFFFRADSNGDGVLSKDEMKSARDSMLAQYPILRVVAQKNASLQPAPGSAAANTATSLQLLLDSNNDGQLQASEVRQIVPDERDGPVRHGRYEPRQSAQPDGSQRRDPRDGEVGRPGRVQCRRRRPQRPDQPGRVRQGDHRARQRDLPGDGHEQRRPDLPAGGRIRPSGDHEPAQYAPRPRARQLGAEPSPFRQDSRPGRPGPQLRWRSPAGSGYARSAAVTTGSSQDGIPSAPCDHPGPRRGPVGVVLLSKAPCQAVFAAARTASSATIWASPSSPGAPPVPFVATASVKESTIAAYWLVPSKDHSSTPFAPR